MKISDELKSLNDSFQVYICDNGYMIETSGMDHDDNYKNVKYVFTAIDQVHEAIDNLIKIPRCN